MFIAFESFEVTQFGQDGACSDPTDSGNRPQEIIIVIIVFVTVGSERIGYFTKLHIEEIVLVHHAIDHGISGGVVAFDGADPMSKRMRPFRLIEVFGDGNAQIKELHFDLSF